MDEEFQNSYALQVLVEHSTRATLTPTTTTTPSLTHTAFLCSQSNVSVLSQPGLYKSGMILCYRMTFEKEKKP